MCKKIIHFYAQKLCLSKDKPKALKRDSIYNIEFLFLEKGFQAFIYI